MDIKDEKVLKELCDELDNKSNELLVEYDFSNLNFGITDEDIFTTMKCYNKNVRFVDNLEEGFEKITNALYFESCSNETIDYLTSVLLDCKIQTLAQINNSDIQVYIGETKVFYNNQLERAEIEFEFFVKSLTK